jgi:hypothetical protein
MILVIKEHIPGNPLGWDLSIRTILIIRAVGSNRGFIHLHRIANDHERAMKPSFQYLIHSRASLNTCVMAVHVILSFCGVFYGSENAGMGGGPGGEEEDKPGESAKMTGWEWQGRGTVQKVSVLVTEATGDACVM